MKNHSSAVTVECSFRNRRTWKTTSAFIQANGLTSAKFVKRLLPGIRPCGTTVEFIRARNLIVATSVARRSTRRRISRTTPKFIQARNRIGNFRVVSSWDSQIDECMCIVRRKFIFICYFQRILLLFGTWMWRFFFNLNGFVHFEDGLWINYIIKCSDESIMFIGIVACFISCTHDRLLLSPDFKIIPVLEYRECNKVLAFYSYYFHNTSKKKIIYFFGTESIFINCTIYMGIVYKKIVLWEKEILWNSFWLPDRD